MRQVQCPDCKAPMVLRDGKFGYFYSCSMYRQTNCPGKWKADAEGNPVGKGVKQALRTARKDAYQQFNALWSPTPMEPREAYGWLRSKLWPEEKGYRSVSFKDMSMTECKRVFSLIPEFQEKLTREGWLDNVPAPPSTEDYDSYRSAYDEGEA